MSLTFFLAPVLANSALIEQLEQLILESAAFEPTPAEAPLKTAREEMDELALLDDAEGGDIFPFYRSVDVHHGKKFYLYGDEQMDYYDAREFCARRKQILVEPHNLMEDQALEHLMKSSNVGVKDWGGVWIGLKDVKHEKHFKWESGHQSQYRNWADGQPDNATGNQDCAVKAAGFDLKWDDEFCQIKKNVVCMTERGGDKKRVWSQKPLEGGKSIDKQFVTFDRVKRDWAETRKFCLEQGMTMAEVYHSTDVFHLRRILEDNGFYEVPIGLKEFDGEGDWRWDSGSENTYRNWQAGQPDNFINVEHCAEFNRQGLMNDIGCSGSRKGSTVCMIDGPLSKVVQRDSGREYLVYDDVARTRADAATFCDHRGATLATVCNAEENATVFNLLKNHFGPGYKSHAWLSLNDKSREGHFEWSPKSGCEYRNWASFEPNNVGGGEDLVVMKNDGKWNDVNTWNRALTLCMR